MLSQERLQAGIRESTARLADVVASQDEAIGIPTCPDWSLRQLATHVGRGHRWAGEIVNRRSGEFVPYREVPDGRLPDDPAARPGWLNEGADLLIDAVGKAGDEQVWTFFGLLPAGFWMRRMTYETAVHCADAELAVGREVVLPSDLAADGIDEWLGFLSHGGREQAPLPEGKTLHVHATDEGLGDNGEWLISGTPSGITVQAGHAKADAAVRGPATTLLLVLTRRLPMPQPGTDVLGDKTLFTGWLENTRF
jgi:uncharacterized protein (TIGR03083 family)